MDDAGKMHASLLAVQSCEREDLREIAERAVARGMEMERNTVEHPPHYTDGAIECINALRQVLSPEQFAGFCRGNLIKYAWRAGKKGAAVEDAKKCAVYAQWWAEALHGGR